MRGFAPISRHRHLGRNGQPARLRLQTATQSATANAAARDDLHMADLHAGHAPAMEYFAVVNAPAADPRPGEYSNRRARLARSTETEFAVHSRVHIVQQDRGTLEMRFQYLRQLDLFPSEVRCFQDDSLVLVDRTRHAD